MKYLKRSLLILAITTMTMCSVQKNTHWNSHAKIQHLKNLNDPSTWDTVLLNRDISSNRERLTKPLRFGAFPVPKYELLGAETFKGVGTAGNFIGLDIYGKKILYSYFLVNRNVFTQRFIKVKPNEVFFTIVTITDFIDTTNYSHAGVQIISRNNPDYIGQGFFKTKNDEIDYLAFLTAERDEFAIVNMRLFNLKNGRIILIAPQKDNSLRSMQIQCPILDDKELPTYINEMLKLDIVKRFITNQNNI